MPSVRKENDMTTYTAQQAGEEKAFQAIRLGDDSTSQATLPSHVEHELRLSVKWYATSKGLRAVWQKNIGQSRKTIP
jgi:hypothetical protein